MSTVPGFELGQRVVATEQAYESGVFERKRAPIHGQVVGLNSTAPDYVVVRREGLKTRERYHADFWQRAPSEEANG